MVINSLYKQIIKHCFQHLKITEETKHINADYLDGLTDYSHSTSLSNIYRGKTWDSLTTSAETHRPPPVPVNDDDEKFVTNVIQEIKHAILNQRINPFRAIKPTGNINQSESNTQNERNDVMHDKLNTQIMRALFAIIVIRTSRLIIQFIHFQNQNNNLLLVPHAQTL